MADLKKVTGCKPCGSQILIELLTTQELANTKLFLTNKKQKDDFQAIVLAVGPSIKTENYGFNVGDRVVISGGAVPVPDYGPESERERVLVEPSTIKAVLV
jgi:co-chaperonin GroES (HSP10)